MKGNKAIILAIIIVAIFLNISAFGLIGLRTVEVFSNNSNNENYLFKDIEYKEASLEKYTVYGTHLNLEIKVDIDEDIENIYTSKLIFKSSNMDILEYELEYEISDNYIIFNTSDNINTGINLENIDIGEYVVLLCIGTENVKLSKLEKHYYTISNNTEYENLEYYTISRENNNNKIDIFFEDNNFCMSVYNTTLPKDVYDIVIDAGHGGKDSGACANGYMESEITLKYAINLKEKLEKEGFKVKLTRDENKTRLKTYGKGGRYTVANEACAKLQLSIHLNSSNFDDSSGIEVYSPNDSDLTFARSIAKNLINNISSISRNKEAKVEDGVYVRLFTDEDILEVEEYARENDFIPYNIKSNTSYYGIIRESGGICTGAYIDGRDKNYDINPYYNSNIGVETYLLELGYINNKEEVTNIIDNMNEYTDIINECIKYYLKM